MPEEANLPKDSWGEVDVQSRPVFWMWCYLALLKDPLCAPCKKHQSNITTANPTAHVDPSINLLAQNIHHSAAFFERQASQSRLHQKVHSVATKSQASQNILARTAAMHKQNKGDDIMFQVVCFTGLLILGLPKSSSVEVSLVQGSDNQKIDDSYLLGTVGELFNQLQKSGTLSPTTENKCKLILRFTAWEKKPAIDEEANFSDADVIAVSKRRSNSAPATSPPKRKVRKIKVAIRVHSEQSGPLKSQTVSPAEKLEYETFQFTRFDYELDETGRMCEIHAKEGLPVGGYISKGLLKYAFKGCLGGKEYAIFQGIPSWTFDTQNSMDLHDELKLLRCGEYFLEDFKKHIWHASECQTSLIPHKICIEWHSESDTFIGQLVPPLKNLGCAAADQLQNMLFNTFLAAPLLDIRAKGNEEVCFVGNTDIENNKYALPAVINAFIHSALVDSAGQYLFTDLQGLVYPGNFPDQTVILFDPQAHTPSFSSGHWDLGPSQIYKFVKQHIYNKFCRMADLDDIRTFDQSLIAAPSAENGNEEVEVEAQNGKSVHSIPRRSHPLHEGWE
ncbi:hypothetical protein CPB84DRAFT_1847003 [Gymnopilus junonius]|uniref:Alpha-type protein kinase domain-containing protein n=1 Tax=Gymnopilus junonius TaxID=109634 RepID=A0A9P5NL58_GYMJU|nr:hypothetical protein CPB84DRAFT_1847003 [Gymnopilus junonius]